MKRLPTVALGVALCTLASGADARPSEIPFSPSDSYPHYTDSDRGYSRPRSKARSLRGGKRRLHTARASRRTAGHRSARRRTAPRGSPVAGRGLVDFARGGTSRACLTPAARSLLARIEAQFGTVRVISTCRPGAVIAGSRRPSRHANGNAIDFNAPPGRKGEIVRWLIANHRTGGIMTYAGMGHIHVDVGPRFVSLNSGNRRWR